MESAVSQVPQANNEPVLGYAPDSSERAVLKEALSALSAETRELPSVIGGQVLMGSKTADVVSPHNHKKVLGKRAVATAKDVESAVNAALAAKHDWQSMSYEHRAGIMLRAAELLATRFRAKINAATMLGQSKTAHQAEIDAACELIDFLRFNVHYGREIVSEQPNSSTGVWNRIDYRPLEGFVLAVTPFNFTAIAGNLPTAPALLGNTVVWKPAGTQAFAAQVFMEVLEDAGLPPGVINLVHGTGSEIGHVVLKHQDLAGIHFTGSTETFRSLWSSVANNLNAYRTYPRIVGETGGKDFIVAHESADLEALATAIVRGAFEYQGQKCSAASRLYVPHSMWSELSGRLESEIKALKVGDVSDFSNFMGAVIDKASFDNIKSYIDFAKQDSEAEVWLGGECDDSTGYFVQPTVVLTDNPKHKLMSEEIFGPVLTVYRYRESFEEVLRLCDETSPYALTGAVFARDRQAVVQASTVLRQAAGNFYINDKPTGAVVGEQPFGGARASGTNDKAGSPINLRRWVSPRTIKENLEPPREVGYPFLLEP